MFQDGSQSGSDDEAIDVTPTWNANGEMTDAGAPVTETDDGSAFLAELASAMKTAAAAEKSRVTAEIRRRREARIA